MLTIDKAKLPARFWDKVNESDECWLWVGGRSDGYGLFWWNGRTVLAHRLAYETFVRAVPKGYELDHDCRVRHCVRPDHVFATTHRQNSIRRFSSLTRCPNGHKYTADNLVFYDRGAGGVNRRCRICRRIDARKYQARTRPPKPTRPSDTAILKARRLARRMKKRPERS